MHSSNSHRCFLAAAAALLACLVLAPLGQAKTPHPLRVHFAARTLLVKFSNPDTAATEVGRSGDQAISRITGGVELVRIQAGESVLSKVSEYSARRDVDYAEPNYIILPDTVGNPNDPLFGQQWALPRIEAVEGWDVFPGTQPPPGGPKVAIVDTGVWAAHPDLAGQVDTSDGAGCLGVSLVCRSASSSADDMGHGTHVAGIVAAATDNGVGIAGVDPGARIVPVKVCFRNADLGCPVASIANGIAWAVAHGARVVNLSLGGPGASTTLCDAVTRALNAGVVVVAAAGNGGTSQRTYPAACSGAIGVAATGPNDESPEWSNWDYPNVFVSAPGGSTFNPPTGGDPATEILSTVPFGVSGPGFRFYEALEGTSMAAPHVSGLAALLLDQRSRTPGEVRRVIAKTSDRVWAGIGASYGGWGLRGPDPFRTCASCLWDGFWGYGRINVRRALIGGQPFATTFQPTKGRVGTTVTLNGEDIAAATSVGVGGGLTSSILSRSSENSIRFAVPTAATSGQISVTTPAGTASTTSTFTVTPGVTGFSPTAAPAGATVTVSGTTLAGTTSVRIGSIAVAPGTVAAGTVTFAVPSPAPTGKITVATLAGTATTTGTFTGIRTPAVSYFTPGSGAPGATLTISGSNLTSIQSITFDGHEAASFTPVSGGSVKAVVPVDATTGKLAVTNPAGTGLSAGNFTVAPKIVGFAPSSAPRGDIVTITGYNLAGATAVRFGSVPGSFSPQLDGSIAATVPPTAVTAKLFVTTPAGTAQSTDNFVVVLPPTIASFSPGAGASGAKVTINGANVGSATGVSFGGTAAGPPTILSSSAITALVPNGALTGPITLSSPLGDATSATSFKVAPRITGFSPTSGPAATSVTVVGTALAGATSLKLNGVAVPFTESGGSLAFVVPAGGATGLLSVTTPGGASTSTSPFTVVRVPAVSLVTPSGAAVGATATLGGSNLVSATGVMFAGGAAASSVVVSGSSLRVVVPPTAVTGPVTVTNSAGSGASASAFRVLPTITGLAPVRTLAGGHVIITGTGLGSATAARVGAVAASFVAVDASHVDVTVPPTASNGAITITTTGGSATTTAQLVVIKPPTLASFTPASGWPGSSVTLSGTNLDSVTSVTLGGASASFTVGSATSLTAIVPATATTGAIIVENPAG
ncbi:MAG: hypothetical protein QOI71_3508, partial [Gaiellales bacterium]|nr:hypothetical protein [Gaiellales bacterium]